MFAKALDGKTVCFVSDNRDRGFNWGCRATSIALRSLVERHGIIESVIYGETVDRPISRGPWELLMKFGPVKSAFSHYGGKRPIGRLIASSANMLRTKGWYADLCHHDPNIFLKRMLDSRRTHAIVDQILSSVESSDCMVVNGEGDMIFTTPQRRTLSFILMLMSYALSIGKEVYYVNGIISDCPITGRNSVTAEICRDILNRCAGVSVRDTESLELAHSIGICGAKYIPDALFSWYLKPEFQGATLAMSTEYVPSPEYPERLKDFARFPSRYFCFCGSGVASNQSSKREVCRSYHSVAVALKELLAKRNVGLVVVAASGADEYMEDIARAVEAPYIPPQTNIYVAARLLAASEGFVTGRYHPAIMASLGRRKCVFLGSNSHKTRSLQRLLGYEAVEEYPVIPTSRDIEGILAAVGRIVDDSCKIREELMMGLAVQAASLFGNGRFE